MLGTFIKTPSSHTTEIIGEVGYDFVVIDQEHAPFDRGTIDLACLGARASGTAAIVRVSEPTPASILSVLDVGAIGVLVPHCDSLEKTKNDRAGLPLSRRQPRLFQHDPGRPLGRRGDARAHGQRGLPRHLRGDDRG